MPVPRKYLRQLELAFLDASFQAWQSLGNTSPADDSGAAGETRSCILASRALPNSLSVLALSTDESSSPLLREMSGYRALLKSLSAPEPDVPTIAIQNLLPSCAPGNRRAQKILSAVGCIIGGSPGEVPGLDRQSAFISAAEFFMEAGSPRIASSLVSRGGWDLPHAYRTAALTLTVARHPRPARVAWEMGAGMGDDVSSAHCAAFDYLEGRGSPSRFRALHRAAERGYILPLLVAAASLELGIGVDRDLSLASAYMSVARLLDSRLEMLPEIRERLNGGRPLSCEHRTTPSNASAIIFNWASKHVSDPIHVCAAEEWHRLRGQGRRSNQ